MSPLYVLHCDPAVDANNESLLSWNAVSVYYSIFPSGVDGFGVLPDGNIWDRVELMMGWGYYSPSISLSPTDVPGWGHYFNRNPATDRHAANDTTAFQYHRTRCTVL